MAQDISAFGKPVAKANAASILNSPALNEMPSAATPNKLPGSESAKHYAHVLFSCYALKKSETDPMALKTIEDFVQFADQKYSDLALQDDELSDLAPPAPSVPPAPMPAPPPSQAPPAPGPTPAPPSGPTIPGM